MSISSVPKVNLIINFLFLELVKTIYKRDQRFWARRPLTRDMILYAAYDVMPLVPHLYDLLNASIKSEFRPLLDELCAENLLALLQPDDVKKSKKQRKMDMEVLELRQKLATVQGKGVVLSNREIRLLRYVILFLFVFMYQKGLFSILIS